MGIPSTTRAQGFRGLHALAGPRRSLAGCVAVVIVASCGAIAATASDASAAATRDSGPRVAERARAGATEHAAARGRPTPTSKILRRDRIVNADLWGRKPRMMAGGLGFTNIIGVPGLSVTDPATSEVIARAAGGTWNTVDCSASGATPTLAAFTSAATPLNVAIAFGFPPLNLDGLPIEFSWPIRPSRLDPTDFRLTLNTGEKVRPRLAGITPNFEFNERSVAVIFGEFGNRLPPENSRSVYPVRIRVVRDESPLQLVGPRGRLRSAVGLKVRSGTAYQGRAGVSPRQRAGPHLAAAKLSRMSTKGEGAPPPFDGVMPNDGVALYGEDAQYRLRIYTTGGFSPDGVRAVFPTEFSRYFRLRAKTRSGRKIRLTETGVDYEIDGKTVRVVGLADLGRKQEVYDDCYAEDGDNYIDIVLAGDRAAVRRITHVEIPSVGHFSPFFNPGGPGNDPTPGTRYSALSPPIAQPVTDALRNPRTTTFRRR